VGENVLLKVKPKKSSLNLGSFTKIAAGFYDPFEIFDGIGPVTPPFPGVTRGDHVLRPAMENMIYTMMMMINMSTDCSPTTPLIFLPT
jgi:hypothetical protein